MYGFFKDIDKILIGLGLALFALGGGAYWLMQEFWNMF